MLLPEVALAFFSRASAVAPDAFLSCSEEIESQGATVARTTVWGGGQHGKRKDASEARSSSAGPPRAPMAEADGTRHDLVTFNKAWPLDYAAKAVMTSVS